MGKQWIAAVTLVVGTLTSSCVLADGNEFIVECKQAVAALDAPQWPEGMSKLKFGHCIGVVEGVMNTMSYMNKRLDPDVQVCWPAKPITNGQATRIAVKFMEQNPALLSEDSSLLVIKALLQAYPCK